jgi:flagellin
MVINTNITAQAASNNLQASQELMSHSLQRLSSGNKIVTPADDAGGLATANRLDAQISRIDAAKTDVGNAISFTQTQDGYLKGVSKALSRMSELSVLAMDVTKTDSDRAAYVSEYSQLSSFITDATDKTFNNVRLFNTAGSGTLDVPIDADGSLYLSMEPIDMQGTIVDLISTSSIDTIANAKAALDAIKTAITNCSQNRASVGAYQSRLNYSSDQLLVSKQNISSASSRIQDTDVADESTNFARANILQQSGTAMLAQANQMPQSVLKLLQ